MTVDVERDEDGDDMAEHAAVCSSGELAAVTSRCESSADERNGGGNVEQDERRVHVQDVVPKACELMITARVSGDAARMIPHRRLPR